MYWDITHMEVYAVDGKRLLLLSYKHGHPACDVVFLVDSK